MIRFLKRVWNDRRGNVIIIGAAALPLVVGAAGLATDTIQWTVWKRQLQRAADSAAFAGVYAKAQNAAVNQAVSTDLDNNNDTMAGLVAGYPQISYPESPSWTNPVQVTLVAKKNLGFSSLFLSAAPTITASATAAMISTGNFCAGAKEGITVGGSSIVNLGCPAISNLPACPSVTTNGSTYLFSAPLVAGAGCLNPINGVTELQPFHMPMPDPFANKYSTDIPSDVPCKNLNQNKDTQQSTGQLTVLNPGCYSGNNAFKLTGTYKLKPGVYFLNSTDFDTTGGATVTGTGVTIILTGSAPGSVQTNGNSTVQLSAPTSSNCGTYGGVNSCDYEKMLLIQSSNATTGNDNKINGNNASSFDGGLYFPNGQVTFNGSSAATTKCVMVFAYKLNFSGNTNLQNDTTGCTANGTFKGKEVRLVG